MDIGKLIIEFFNSTTIVAFFNQNGWMNLIMILVGIAFLVLALKFKFEPYLLIPISIGMILTNIVFINADGSLQNALFIKEGVDASGNVITDKLG